MKSLLGLLIVMMFALGCAVQAEEQADKQLSEMTNQDSQGEKKTSGDTGSPEEEEEPECE